MNIDRTIADILSRFDRKSVHDTDFLAFSLFKRPINLILDVGANLGQSIASFRLTYPQAKIISFEANPMLAAGLSGVADTLPGENIVVHFGLSDEAGNFIINVPYVSEQPFLEEASISVDYYELPWVKQKFIDRGGLTKLQQVSCTLETGDAHGFAPDILKIDVEGAEAKVLKGLRNTVEQFRPIVFVENSDWHNVTAFMNQLGYFPFRYENEKHRLVPFYGATTNTFYLSDRDLPFV
jgi:FkbM family methyltransferase